MSDVYRDLGYIPKNELEPLKVPGMIWGTKDFRRQALSRERVFSFLREYEPSVQDKGEGSVFIRVGAHRIEIFPSSGCYMSGSKFGQGVDSLREFIRSL